jgi:predicted flap endonuclease-1-like 5' DNA nuclease
LGQDIGASEHIEEVMLQTPVAEPAVEAPVVEAPAAEAAPAAALTDISLVDGIGPKYKAALEAAGVTSLQMMAELSDEKIAEVEAAASLEGKFAAGEWKVQAQEIVSGKAPRAKVDQAAAAKA